MAKAGQYMGGCLGWHPPVVHVLPSVMSTKPAVMILTGSSVAVRT